MKTLTACLGLIWILPLLDGPPVVAGSRFDIVRDGQPACAIVVAERPSPGARLAALELQSHVLKITGVELPLRNDTEPSPGPRILVGESAATRALGLRGTDFPPQEYLATLAYWNYAYPPRDFDLESNVSIAPCLHTCAYAIDDAVRENDMKFYRAWLAKAKAPMFLWNYYHHPMEPALIDKWKCFPNVMVHETARAARMFIQDGVRGIFECGEQDQLEHYVMLKLWDDPGLETDAVLDEFFTLYFGRAARPMNQFYRSIESMACDQALYPPGIHKQNKDIAWRNLGTPDRLKNLAALMAEADALAGTEIERQRVALWRNSIWKWMLDGRAEYEARTAKSTGAP